MIKSIKFLLVWVVSFSLISCTFFTSKKETEITKISDSTKVSQQITSAPSTLLNIDAEKEIQHWKEYQKTTELIKAYYNISTFEALQNASELATATQQLKDSIKIEKLKIATVRARLNVLHNEALRLQDMADIPSITDEEIKEKVHRILQLYSSLNAKVNSIYSVEKYNFDDIK